MKYFLALSLSFLLLGSTAFAAALCPDGSDGVSNTAQYKMVNGVCFPSATGLAETDVKVIVVGLLGWLMGIFGVLGLIAFIIAGVVYLTAGGDAEREKSAKKAMYMAVLGVIVGLSGFVIIQFINSALNGKAV